MTMAVLKAPLLSIVGVLLGNGDGTFQTAVNYGSGGYATMSVTVADLNGDGKPDLVVGNCGSSTNDCNNLTVEVRTTHSRGAAEQKLVDHLLMIKVSWSTARLSLTFQSGIINGVSSLMISFCINRFISSSSSKSEAISLEVSEAFSAVTHAEPASS